MFAREWGGPGDRVSESSLLGPARPYVVVDKNELEPDLAVAEPQVTEEARASLESIIDSDERMDLPAAVSRILMAARPVAHLTTKVGSATGFLIAPSLLMTNNHAFLRKNQRRVATEADANDARAMFNFQQDVDGNFAASRQYALEPESFFLADQELDCAVVGIEGEPGAEWGTLALPRPSVKVEQGDDVFIIQHPRGGPKQIVMANNEIDYIDDTFVQYSTDTLRGSSGSPVFDWQWRLVAIHHASGKLRGGNSPAKRYANEGVLLHAIARKLGLKKLVGAARSGGRGAA